MGQRVEGGGTAAEIAVLIQQVVAGKPQITGILFKKFQSDGAIQHIGNFVFTALLEIACERVIRLQNNVAQCDPRQVGA